MRSGVILVEDVAILWIVLLEEAGLEVGEVLDVVQLLEQRVGGWSQEDTTQEHC